MFFSTSTESSLRRNKLWKTKAISRGFSKTLMQGSRRFLKFTVKDSIRELCSSTIQSKMLRRKCSLLTKRRKGNELVMSEKDR